jgi:hypothetical protein
MHLYITYVYKCVHVRVCVFCVCVYVCVCVCVCVYVCVRVLHVSVCGSVYEHMST